nr:hypothetical protein GCM10020092_068670 [Actinoplanes digitatis]
MVFTLMAADERSLSAGELAERLDVSPAAISGAVRYLTQLSMVTREHVPGSRRDRYRLVDDSWYEVTVAKMTLLKTLADAAAQGAAAAGGRDTIAGGATGGHERLLQLGAGQPARPCWSAGPSSRPPPRGAIRARTGSPCPAR